VCTSAVLSFHSAINLCAGKRRRLLLPDDDAPPLDARDETIFTVK
jgi:hypothetical protein